MTSLIIFTLVVIYSIIGLYVATEIDLIPWTFKDSNKPRFILIFFLTGPLTWLVFSISYMIYKIQFNSELNNWLFNKKE